MRFYCNVLLLLESCLHCICGSLALSCSRLRSRSCLNAAVLCAFDGILKRILEADGELGQDSLAVVFETCIRIITEERISFLRILLVRDLVVEVYELCKRLAHDELRSCLYGCIVALDLVNVLKELAGCLIVT